MKDTEKKLMLFGEEYLLQRLPAYGRTKVFQDRECINLYLRQRNSEKEAEQKISRWYRGQLSRYLEIAVPKIRLLFEEYKMQDPTWAIRIMKARWGSCMVERGHMIFNLYLVKAPKECIDYVILHELSHFLFPNHGKEFKHFLTLKMPDWKERHSILNRLPITMSVW